MPGPYASTGMPPPIGKWPPRRSVRIREAAIPHVTASRESTRKTQSYFRAA